MAPGRGPSFFRVGVGMGMVEEMKGEELKRLGPPLGFGDGNVLPLATD